MAVTHVTSARNAACNAVVDLLDTGSATASGRLAVLAGDDSLVASLPLSYPAFGNAANGTATANSITSDANAVGGTMAKFELRNRDAAAIVLGVITVTGGGGDITFGSLVVAPGDTVGITSLTYSAAP